MSLALPIARGTGSLPHQSLKQEMALLGLAIADANQLWTAYPAKFETDGMRTDASSFNGVSEET
jgi:hypothetical protein